MNDSKQKLILLGGTLGVFTVGAFICSIILGEEHSTLPVEKTVATRQVVAKRVEGMEKAVYGENEKIDDKEKSELIEKVKNEIKRGNFRSNLDYSINKWVKELRDKYSYAFDDATKDKIESYELTTKAVWRIKNRNDKNEYIKNMTDVLFYIECKYTQNYTPEQLDFLFDFYSDEHEKAISKYGNLLLPNRCGKSKR